MWYKNGERWIEQSYKNGLRDGYSTFFTENGDVRKRTAHRNGKFILLEDWEGTEEEEKEAFKTVNKDGMSLRYLRYGIFPYSGMLTLVDDKGKKVKEEDFLEGLVYKK
jgi:antitoxin component YwqK of YwqJK toxin-antitoxin module